MLRRSKIQWVCVTDYCMMLICVVYSPVAAERRLMMRKRGNLVPAIIQIKRLE